MSHCDNSFVILRISGVRWLYGQQDVFVSVHMSGPYGIHNIPLDFVGGHGL